MTPLSGCWRIDVACRRACRSPRRASVISFSISGFTALALASVVLIRSWSMTSMERFIRSDLRCEGLLDSLWRSRRWRIRLGAQRQAPRLEGLDDLLDRLATEVRDCVQLRLRLLEQVADRLDARPLEAVVRAHAQLELLDQDV